MPQPGPGFAAAILDRPGRYFGYAQAGFTLSNRSRVELQSRKVAFEVVP